MCVNTGYEYWGQAGSLIHITPTGQTDVALLGTDLIYHMANV